MTRSSAPTSPRRCAAPVRRSSAGRPGSRRSTPAALTRLLPLLVLASPVVGPGAADAAEPSAAILTGLRSDGPAHRGARAAFRFTARNAGGAATGDPLVVRFASGFASPRLTDLQGTGDGWSCAAEDDALRCASDASVDAGASATPLVVSGLAPAVPSSGTEVQLVASFSGPPEGATGDPSATVPLVDATPADLVISATAVAPTPSGSGPQFDVRVRNASGTATTDPAVVSFGVAPSSASGVGWSCETLTAGCRYLLPLVGGAEAPPLHVMTAPTTGASGSPYLTAAVSGGGDQDPARMNDVASARGVVVPRSQVDLTVAVSGRADPPVGGRAGFSVLIGNAGRRPSTGVVTVRLATRNGNRTATPSGDGWTCPSAGSACTTTTPVPAGGRAAPLLVDAPADDGTPTGTSSIVATVSGGDDAVDGNDAAGASRSVGIAAPGVADVALGDVLPRRRGTSSSPSVLVSNDGPTDVAGPLEVRLASALSASASGDGWSCTAALVCRRSDGLAGGAEAPPILLEQRVDVLAVRQAYDTAATVVSGGGAATRTVGAGTTVGAPLTDVVLTIPERHPLLQGEQASYPLRVQDVGDDPAPGPVTVSLGPFSPGTTFSGDGWACPTRNLRGQRCIHDGPVPAGGALPDLVARHEAGRLGTPGVVSIDGAVTLPVGSDVDPTNDAASSSATLGGDGIELTPAFGAMAPAFGGAPGSGEVVVRNTGSRPSSGDVVLRPVGWAGADGNGWRCATSCRYADVIAPGVVSPPLRLRIGDAGILETTLTGGGDDHAVSAHAAARVPVAPPRPTPYLTLGGFAPAARPGGGSTLSVQIGSKDGVPVVGPLDLRIDPSPGVVASDLTGPGLVCAGLRCQVENGLPAGVTRTLTARLRVTSRVGGPAVVRVRASSPTPDVGAAETRVRITPIGSGGDLVASVDAPGPVSGGGEAAPRVVVRNTGQAPVRGPVRADLRFTVPFGTLDRASGDGWVCEPDGTTCLHQGPVAGGAALPPIDLRLPVPRLQGAGDRSQLSATVTALSDDDTGDANGTASGSVAVSGADGPNLSVAVASTGPLDATGPARFEARVRNTGTRASTAPVDVQYRGAIGPNGALTPSGAGWACPDGDDGCVYRGTLAAGQSTPPLVLTAPGSPFFGVTPNTAGVNLRSADGTAADDGGYAEAPRPPSPLATGVDASISLTGGDPIVDDDSTVLRAQVRGAGTAPAPGGTTVRFTAPAARATASGDGWTCTTELTCTTDRPVSPGTDLPPVDVALRRVATDPAAATRITARVTAPSDAFPSDDQAVSTVGTGDGRTDLAVTATRTVPPRAGTDGVTTVQVKNAGTRPTSGTTTLDVAAGVAPVPSGSGWSCGGTRCTYDAAIAAGSSAPAVRILQSFAADSALGTDRLTATVSGGGDAAPGNDAASTEAGIGVGDRPAPGRSVRLGIDPTLESARPGQAVAVQLTVRGGPDEAAGPATATVDLPEGISYAPSLLDAPAPTVSGSRLTWTFDVPDDRRPVALQFATVVSAVAAPGPRELRAALAKSGTADEQDSSSLLVVPPDPPEPDASTPPATATTPSTGVPPTTGSADGIAAYLAALTAAGRPTTSKPPTTAPPAIAPPATAPARPTIRLSTGTVPRTRVLARSGWLVPARVSAVGGLEVALLADRTTARRLHVRTGSVLALATVGARRAGAVRVRIRVPAPLRTRVARASRITGTLRARATASAGTTTVSRRVVVRR